VCVCVCFLINSVHKKIVFIGTPNANKTGNVRMYNLTFRRIGATIVAVEKQ